MSKILFIAGHTRHSDKTGMLAETIKREQDKGNDIIFLDCGGICNGYCASVKGKGRIYCSKCVTACKAVCEWTDIPKDKIYKMHKVDLPQYPKFKSIQEMMNYEFDGLNAGVSVVSTIMTITRDYQFDVKKWQKTSEKFFNTFYITLKNVEEIYEKEHFDEIHTYTGRFSIPYAGVQFAKKNNLDFILYSGGSYITKVEAYKNRLLHSLIGWRQRVQEYWNNSNPEKRDEIAQNWFIDRRNAKIQSDVLFTASQKRNLIPSNYDKTKENIVIFNSSIDEVYAFDEWKNPIADNEMDILNAIFERYKDDTNKHFYLRLHPNLKKAKSHKTKQMKQINELKKRKYKNLTIIEPDNKIDSYSMIELANKVLTFMSTIGCESTFWGKPVILAGVAPYDELDCVYKVSTYEELFSLIETDNLLPKPKENTYPYGYYNNSYGTQYKYFDRTGFGDGSFLGHSVRIKENSINEFYKKILNKY